MRARCPSATSSTTKRAIIERAEAPKLGKNPNVDTESPDKDREEALVR